MQPHLERCHAPHDGDDAADIWAARYGKACQAFTEREISTDVFKALLYGLGFRGAELETEVNLHWPK